MLKICALCNVSVCIYHVCQVFSRYFSKAAKEKNLVRKNPVFNSLSKSNVLLSKKKAKRKAFYALDV